MNMPVITTKPDCSIVLIEKVLFTAYSVSPPHNASSSCKVVLVLRYNSAKQFYFHFATFITTNAGVQTGHVPMCHL